MAEEKSKSLAQELEEQLSQESQRPSRKKIVEDATDEEIQKASDSITKKDIDEEKKALKRNVDGKKETLIPLEDYIKCAVHLGTKVITPHMRTYVYKRRADGLAVINTTLIDERLREAITFLKKFEPEDIYLCCKREVAWPAAETFGEVTGIRIFTKKYPPGVTTNLVLEDFFESKLTIICDPWIDKNALNDTARLKKPVLSICDTNNYTTNVTQLIPGNNKSRKSIGCILYILAREYTKEKGMPFSAKLEDFTGPLE